MVFKLDCCDVFTPVTNRSEGSGWWMIGALMNLSLSFLKASVHLSLLKSVLKPYMNRWKKLANHRNHCRSSVVWVWVHTITASNIDWSILTPHSFRMYSRNMSDAKWSLHYSNFIKSWFSSRCWSTCHTWWIWSFSEGENNKISMYTITKWFRNSLRNALNAKEARINAYDMTWYS